jgi:CheY-like chemotaxis protein
MANRSIMIVEDNERNRRLLRVLLKSKGYRITEAKNGHEALKAFDIERPDLILMDIQLPEMDGLELIRIFKNKTDEIPIIAVTAYAMKGDRERILSSGCDGYVSKPIDTRKLTQVIATTLGEDDE